MPLVVLVNIIEHTTSKGDLVIDPYCGDGLTCFAANVLERRYIGIDKEQNYIDLSEERLNKPLSTIDISKKIYVHDDPQDSSINKGILSGLDLDLTQNIADDEDFYIGKFQNAAILIKVQRNGESLRRARELLLEWKRIKKPKLAILIQTNTANHIDEYCVDDELILIQSTSLIVKRLLSKIFEREKYKNNDKRGKVNPIPDNVYTMLNRKQLHTLVKLETSGGKLRFVRRSSKKRKPIFVVSNHSENVYAILDVDGSLNKESGLKIRNETHRQTLRN
jgi:hypothetical protein